MDDTQTEKRFDHEREPTSEPTGDQPMPAVKPNSWRKTATTEAVEALVEETMETKWGPQTAAPGDYIVTNPDGERYPVDRATFLSTYERVE
ncbi:MAG TPA: hypothetical protein VF638_12950 [Sphingomonas sp.]